MAILNFPNEHPGGGPLQVGDTYNGDNGVVYTYDGVKWVGRTSITIGYTGSKGDPGGNANTGNFVFTASQISVSDNSDIAVVTNANTWTFGSNGTLTLPASSPIIWSTSETSFINFNGAGPVGPGGDLVLGTNGPTNVVIAVDDSSIGTLKSWVFDTNGVLTLPSGNTRIGDVYGAGNDAIVGNTGTAVGIVSQGTSGYVALEWIDNIENIGTTSTQVAAVIVNSTFASTSGTVQILTGVSNGPVSSNIWEFGADGTLTAPGHLMPDADLAYDLGSTTTQWRSIYVGTGTIYIGGVALGVDQNNFVTVDGNPIITVNTAGNFTVQGDTNIVLGAVVISDTAPAATTPGSQWYNSVDGRIYVAYNGTWIDASPTIVPAPETYLGEIAIDGDTLNINGSTLTINTSGTLLVNGSEVTGSGGGGDRLTAGTVSVILGTDGMVTFPEIDGTKTLWGAVDEDFTIKTTRTDPGSDADINIYAADDIFIEANGDDISLTAANDVSINTDGGTYSWQFGGDGIISLPNGLTINASDSIPTVKIGGTSTWISVDNGGAPPGFYVRTDAGGADYQWNFAPDGVLYLSTASTIMGANEDPNVYIETSTTATTSTWTFGTDGVLTLPADTPVIKGGGTGTDVTIIASTGSNTSTWVFAADGGITFPDGTTSTGNVVVANSSSYQIKTNYFIVSNPYTATFEFDEAKLVLPGNGVIKNQGSSWQLDTASQSFIFPNNGKLSYGIIPFISTTINDVVVNAINTGSVYIRSGSNTWAFGNDGRTTFPNGTVPEHSYGASGDKEGMVVFSDPYIYYCKQDYVDNLTDIWVRVAWTGTNW